MTPTLYGESAFLAPDPSITSYGAPLGEHNILFRLAAPDES